MIVILTQANNKKSHDSHIF